MRFLKLFPILIIFFALFPFKNFVSAEVKNSKDYKVLSTDNKQLSIKNVEYYLKQGDNSIENSEFEKAQIEFTLYCSQFRYSNFKKVLSNKKINTFIKKVKQRYKKNPVTL